jgi:hypothetical protein
VPGNPTTLSSSRSKNLLQEEQKKRTTFDVSFGGHPSAGEEICQIVSEGLTLSLLGVLLRTVKDADVRLGSGWLTRALAELINVWKHRTESTVSSHFSLHGTLKPTKRIQF